MTHCHHFLPRPTTRREMLMQASQGFGAVALSGLMAADQARAKPRGGEADYLRPRATHFPPKARSVIFLYMDGGPSQVDTWDPKPELDRWGGRSLPAGNLTTERQTGLALASPFTFRQYGDSGLPCSEVFARTAAAHADRICVVRSMYANTPNHEQSMRLMNCGDERLSRPSYGAWLTNGLGPENQNLPGFVTL